jgi:hypothetical protein
MKTEGFGGDALIFCLFDDCPQLRINFFGGLDLVYGILILVDFHFSHTDWIKI